MSSGEGTSSHSVSGRRSRTKCEKIRELKGTATIDFDEMGSPVGEYASQFASFYAMMVKDNVSCTYQSWKVVPKDKKDEIWAQIKEHFNIKGENEVAKKKTIKMMGERWKNWKADLVKNYIHKENPKNPCDEWTITENEWEEFKRQKTTAEWKEMSKRGKASAQMPKIPHRLGSTGYRGAVTKWKEASSKSSASIPSSIQELDERSQRWVMARCLPDEEGVYKPKDHKTEKVIERLQSLASQDAEQRLPDSDILSVAIGTAEHPGRLRGYSGYVGKKNVYGKTKRSGSSHANCISKQEFDSVVQKVVEEKVAQQVQVILAQLWGHNEQGHGVDHSPRRSHPVTQVCSNDCASAPFQNLQGPVDCNLYLLDNSRQRIKVAEGRCHPFTSDATVHHKPLLPDQLRVSIDKVVDEYVGWTAPFPLEDGTERLGELINSFLVWPAFLVEPLVQTGTPEKQLQRTKHKAIEKVPTALSGVERQPLLHEEIVQGLSEHGVLLYRFLMVQPADLVHLAIPYDEAPFFSDGELVINVVDLIEMLKRERANISILKLFCMYCKKICQDINNEESNSVYFLDPEQCTETNMNIHLAGTTSYIKEVFDKVNAKSSIILVPYLEGGHWVLLVINLLQCKVYLVDSLNPAKIPNLKIKLALDSALRHHWSDDKKNARFSWNRIMGPQQADAVSCGYYVMKSMFSIITHYIQAGQVLPSQIEPVAPHRYSESDLTEVVEVLSDFFLTVV